MAVLAEILPTGNWMMALQTEFCILFSSWFPFFVSFHVNTSNHLSVSALLIPLFNTNTTDTLGPITLVGAKLFCVF